MHKVEIDDDVYELIKRIKWKKETIKVFVRKAVINEIKRRIINRRS